ncbi:MAG TPA: replicative DNA helicase [Bdellovibrionota bacterium]|jgi:replicative DNA helicase
MDFEKPKDTNERPSGASYFGGATFAAPPRATAGGRVPPHNLEAEMNVLGGILLDNRALDSVHEIGVEPDDFYKDAHQKIYAAILELTRRTQPADVITLRNLLMNSGILEKVGGASYIAELVQSDFSVPNVPAYAQIVKEKSSERKIILACTEQAAKAYEGVEDHNAYREETEKRVLEATSEKKLSSYRSLGDTLQDVFTHLQDTASRDTKIVGVPSGFSDLDKETMGWHNGQLIIVAARPGMGKTSLMLNTALHAALQARTSVAFFSMEMTRDELAMRLLSMESRVDAGRLKNASRLQEQDWKHLQRAAGEMHEAQLFLDDTPALNILEIKSRARRIKTQHGLGLVLVDYLQLMRGLGHKGNYSREQEIAEISRGLKAMAKELQVPVIAASQLSREVERREKSKPKLSDLRESGAIEQDADIVLFIHRDKDNPEMQREAELIIGKHRSGNTGEIKLAWHGQYTTFKDYAYGGDSGAAPGRGGTSVDFF